MSLFDEIASELHRASESINSEAGKAAGEVQGRVPEVTGKASGLLGVGNEQQDRIKGLFGKATSKLAPQVDAALKNLKSRFAQELARVDRNVGKANRARDIVGDVVLGNQHSLVDRLLDEIDERLKTTPVEKGSILEGRRTSLVGGITFKEARKMFQLHSAQDLAKANLFIVELSGFKGQKVNDVINLLALSVDYGPVTLTADAIKTGAAYFAGPVSAERTEIRITTLDNSFGDIKKLFEKWAGLVANTDGTYGLPADYLVRARITHAFCGEDAINGKGESAKNNAHRNDFLVMPGSIEYSLNRREDALQEIQFSMIQFDSFTV